MDERPEADALHDAAHAQVRAARPRRSRVTAPRLHAPARAAATRRRRSPAAGIPQDRAGAATDATRRGEDRTLGARDDGSRAHALPSARTIGLDGLDALVDALRERGYCVVGPTRRDGAIVYEEIASADELPAGWTEVQEAATYRLERRDDEARFGYPVGPHSWKR